MSLGDVMPEALYLGQSGRGRLLKKDTQCRTTHAKLWSLLGSNANGVTVSYADTKSQFDEM